MKAFSILPAFILFSAVATGQYIGGTSDGYIQFLSTGQNNTLNIYSGDANDGFTTFSISMQNTAPGIYAGNGDDGFTKGYVQNQNSVPSFFLGGNDDGFSAFISGIQNAMPSLYLGGNDDGVNATTQFVQNNIPSIYAGSENDGSDFRFALVQNSIPDVYRGNISDGFTSFTTRDNPGTFYYIFIGTGNWDIASNWLDNQIPPALLPGPREIIINPSTGSCTLNVIQTLMAGSRLSVAAGKVFVVPGNIY